MLTITQGLAYTGDNVIRALAGVWGEEGGGRGGLYKICQMSPPPSQSDQAGDSSDSNISHYK